MKNKLIPVKFYDDKFYIIFNEGKPYVPIKPVVDNIGLAWASQSAKINEKFGSDLKKQAVIAKDGKKHNMVCLPLPKWSAWLYSVNPSKVSQSVRDKLIRYQSESDAVLSDCCKKKISVITRFKTMKEFLLLMDQSCKIAGQLRREFRPSVRKMLYANLTDVCFMLDRDPPPLETLGYAGVLDGPAMAELWELFEMLENQLTPVLNHSNDPDLIAIEPFSLQRYCKERDLSFPHIDELRQDLHMPSSRPFVGFQSFKSKITKQLVHCWMFKKVAL